MPLDLGSLMIRLKLCIVWKNVSERMLVSVRGIGGVRDTTMYYQAAENIYIIVFTQSLLLI